MILALLLLPGAVSAANGQWVSAPGPAGFSGQLGGIVSAPKGDAIYLQAGFSNVWSGALPLGATPAYTLYAPAGLGNGWFPSSLSPAAPGGAPVISFFALSPPSNRGLLRYFDPPSQSWMQASPNPINFGGVAKLALLTNGDLLASEADSLYASTDNGLNWTLRTNISSSLTAPPPLPAAGNAVGKPAYGTNAVTPTLPGYSEAFNSMPWGEVFLGTEVNSMWHSYDYGSTWEHVDPLFFEPIRDLNGVPLWVNPHITYFGSGGNTVGAGFTKDAEILMNADRSNGFNFYRLTTTGQIVQIDPSAVTLPHTTAFGPVPEHIGQARHFHTLRSGETLSQPTSWQANQGGAVPDGRNLEEIVRWDGATLTLASPAAGSWEPLYSDGSLGADDGTNYFTLLKASSNNLWEWIPDMSGNNRPDVRLVSSPVAVTMSAATGLASLPGAQSFTVTDDGLPSGTLTYGWTARGQGPVTFDAPAALGATAWFSMPGWYVLTLSVSDGQLSSGNSLMVHVLPAAGGAAPQITAQPNNTLLLAGQQAQIALTASGPQLAYQWFRNGVELVDGAAVSGAQAATLTLHAASAADIDSTYYCRVSNPFGRVVGNAAALGGPPSITAQPQGAAVAGGASASFSVAADGSHPMTWQWFSVAGAARTAITSGGNQSSFSTSTAGSYQVDVMNCFGTVSSAVVTLAAGAASTFNLTVNPAGGSSTSGSGAYPLTGGASAPIGITTDRIALAVGRFSHWSTSSPGVSFANANAPQTSVVVTGAAAGANITVSPVYQLATGWWLSVVNGLGSGIASTSTFQAGQAIGVLAYAPPPGTVFDHWVGGPIDGATTAAASFTMPAANLRVTATYRPAGGGVAPQITTPPAPQSVVAGNAATFSVVANGSAPLAYSWAKNGVAIAASNSATYTTPATVIADDGALFTVTVSNGSGSATSSAAKLTVTPAPVAPQITTQPAPQSVDVGTSATFTVAATGAAPLTYAWSRNGTAIAGASAASYTTPATTAADDGATFTVTVQNPAGTATSAAAVLHVKTPTVAVHRSGCGCSGSSGPGGFLPLLAVGMFTLRRRRSSRPAGP